MKADKLIFHFSLPGYFRTGENYGFTHAGSTLLPLSVFVPF